MPRLEININCVEVVLVFSPVTTVLIIPIRNSKWDTGAISVHNVGLLFFLFSVPRLGNTTIRIIEVLLSH